MMSRPSIFAKTGAPKRKIDCDDGTELKKTKIDISINPVNESFGQISNKELQDSLSFSHVASSPVIQTRNNNGITKATGPKGELEMTLSPIPISNTGSKIFPIINSEIFSLCLLQFMTR